MDVSVIIVHYNTPELTKSCIASVIEKTKGISYEVIVVDNASTVHNSDELKVQFPQIQLIKNSKNLGFAGGNNVGIQAAKGEYILLLNSDTVLINDAITLVFNYLKQNKKVGVVSSQLLFPDGKIQSVCQRFPSIKYSLIEILRLQKVLPKDRRGKLLLGAFFDHQTIVEADWVWGAFFMFPHKLLLKLSKKKLDDRYFMYSEDMQWCWDFKKLGYQVHYFPEAKVTHFMGGSSGAKNALIKKSGDLFFETNYSSIHRKIIQLLNKVLL
jgi:GT2 family glycosyltransferase